MPTNTAVTPLDFESSVMRKINSNEIVMKPRWYYMLGSALMMVGLIASAIGVTFLINLTFFLLHQHGPMGQWRLQLILTSFPLWIPVVALFGISVGIFLLKQYDFSYKKHFWLIITGFIISIILAAFALDYFGLDTIWFKTGTMKRNHSQQFKNNSSFSQGREGNDWRNVILY